MEDLTKEILCNIGNTHTKVEEKEDFSGNYYSYVTDTIYLASKMSNDKKAKNNSNINIMLANIVTICHECIHSVQSKYLHIANTLISNLIFILSATCILLRLIFEKHLWLSILALPIVIIGIIIRLILESEAINKSIELASEVILEKNYDNISKDDMEYAKNYINKHKLFAYFQMISDKLFIFLVLIFLIIL